MVIHWKMAAINAKIVLCLSFLAIEVYGFGFNFGFASSKLSRRILVGNTHHSHYSRAASMAGAAIDIKDPFESLRSRMPKESFDLLVSNVDPSTVSAVDLVKTNQCKMICPGSTRID